MDVQTKGSYNFLQAIESSYHTLSIMNIMESSRKLLTPFMVFHELSPSSPVVSKSSLLPDAQDMECEAAIRSKSRFLIR